jgi:hypothetical protein
MIISHSKKFAFFANPKTGSKAVGLTLRLSGIFDKNDIMSAQPFPATRTARIELPEYNLNGHKTYLVDHMNPAEAIEAGYITLEQLRDYNCYAFLRDPEERFFAAEVCMQVSRHGNIAMPDRKGKAAPAQYTYFFVGDALIINPLNFGNFEQEVRFILAQLGADEQIDAPQVSKIIRPHMIYDVEYDPAQHTKDIALYKNMMQ